MIYPKNPLGGLMLLLGAALVQIPAVSQASTASSGGVILKGSGKASGQKWHPEVHLDCSAFRANGDGSWTSLRTTKVGSVSISSGGTFHPGVSLGGVDLGGELGERCKRGVKAN